MQSSAVLRGAWQQAAAAGCRGAWQQAAAGSRVHLFGASCGLHLLAFHYFSHVEQCLSFSTSWDTWMNKQPHSAIPLALPRGCCMLIMCWSTTGVLTHRRKPPLSKSQL